MTNHFLHGFVTFFVSFGVFEAVLTFKEPVVIRLEVICAHVFQMKDYTYTMNILQK